MLPDWLIEELKKEKQPEERPQLEIPAPPPPERKKEEQKDEEKRGVITIQVWGN